MGVGLGNSFKGVSRTPDFFREGEQIAQKQKDPLTCSKDSFVGRLRRIMNTLPGIGAASGRKTNQAAIDLMRGEPH